MYSQITPTFPDAPHDDPDYELTTVSLILGLSPDQIAMFLDSRPEHLCEDEFFNQNSKECVCILFNNDVPIEIINKILKQYTEIYAEMKEANEEMIGEFTAENFIQVLFMKISENMANEGPDRKKPRV